MVEKHASWIHNREGKLTRFFSVEVERKWQESVYYVSRVMRIVECTIDRRGPDSPKRHKAKRRRIKTVMQELMYVAVKNVKTARQIQLLFSPGHCVQAIFCRLYARLSSG